VNQNPYFSQVSDAGVPCCVAAAAGCLEWNIWAKNGEVTRKTKENYRCFDWKSMKHLDLNRFKLNQKRGCHQPKCGFHQPKMGKFMKVPHLETEKWSSKEEFRIMFFSFTASSGFKSSGEKSTQKTVVSRLYRQFLFGIEVAKESSSCSSHFKSLLASSFSRSGQAARSQ
jgi:hypothetical protein